MPNAPKLDKLEQILSYKFKNPATLKLALTHSSASSSNASAPNKTSGGDQITKEWAEDNERLEFLGDRVLGLAIAQLLNERFPMAPEGELARRFNSLVRKETCAEVANELNLGGFLIMGEGERESGGQKKPTILADACEAVLGAVFLDGGYAASQALIHRMWSEKVVISDTPPTDPKSALQEWAQGRQLSLPKYIEKKREGPDHAPSFTAEVHIDGLEPAQGVGSSKRAAEQSAAEAMLQREYIWKSTQ